MIVHDFLMIVVHLLHSANSSVLLVAEGEPIEFSLPGIKNIYARYSAVFLFYRNFDFCQKGYDFSFSGTAIVPLLRRNIASAIAGAGKREGNAIPFRSHCCGMDPPYILRFRKLKTPR